MSNQTDYACVDRMIQHKSSIPFRTMYGLDVKERFIVCSELLFGGSC